MKNRDYLYLRFCLENHILLPLVINIDDRQS